MPRSNRIQQRLARELAAKKNISYQAAMKQVKLAAAAGGDENIPASDVKELTVLNLVDVVRQNPRMYIGGAGSKALMQLIEEALANAVNETLAINSKSVRLTISKDGWVTLEDYGRGLPIAIQEKTGVSGVETIMTNLGAGGKFPTLSDSNPKALKGMRVIGVCVVNALSAHMDVDVYREGYWWKQTYIKGVPQSPLEKEGVSTGRGTKLTFRADPSIFDASAAYDQNVISSRLAELSYLYPGMHFAFKYQDLPEKIFVSQKGMEDCVLARVSERQKLEGDSSEKTALMHPSPIVFSGQTRHSLPAIDLSGGQRQVEDIMDIEVALLWTTSHYPVAQSFVNACRTQGGTHDKGFQQGVYRALEAVAPEFSCDATFSRKDVLEGLYYALAVNMHQPNFDSQSMTMLSNVETEQYISDFVAKEMKHFLLDNKDIAEAVLARVCESRDARLAAEKAKASIKSPQGRPRTLAPKSPLGSANRNFLVGDLIGILAECAPALSKQEAERMVDASWEKTLDEQLAAIDGFLPPEDTAIERLRIHAMDMVKQLWFARRLWTAVASVHATKKPGTQTTLKSVVEELYQPMLELQKQYDKNVVGQAINAANNAVKEPQGFRMWLNYVEAVCHNLAPAEKESSGIFLPLLAEQYRSERYPHEANVLLNEVFDDVKASGDNKKEFFDALVDAGIRTYKDKSGRLYGSVTPLVSSDNMGIEAYKRALDTDAGERTKQFVAAQMSLSDDALGYFRIFADVSQMTTVRFTIPYVYPGTSGSSKESKGMVVTMAAEREGRCLTCKQTVLAEQVASQRDAFIASKQGDWKEHVEEWNYCPYCKTTGDGGVEPSWLPSQSPAYLYPMDLKNRHLLYNFSGAIDWLVGKGNIHGLYVVDDYMDAWRIWDNGQKAVVAFDGDVLSKKQAEQVVMMAVTSKQPVILWPGITQASKQNMQKNIALLRSIDSKVAIEIVNVPDDAPYPLHRPAHKSSGVLSSRLAI